MAVSVGELIIRSYKDEVKNLKKVLSELTKQAQKEKAGCERELKALRQEHRELADLREIIFNQDEKESRPSAELPEDDVFPYEMRKRTVLFGGHETFLKAFRPKFKNLRIVDTGLPAFNPELVRNADVVWIQNNCISHSQYYAIVNAARKYGIQVRYFPYSSADKCANLLVREDRKG